MISANKKRALHSKLKKIWIDLDNSPHVLFFNPIIKELKKRGYRVFVTVRDYAQVIELAELFCLQYRVIGRHYGKSKIVKFIGLLIRSLQMLPFTLRERPDLAFSHGSRSQLLTARIMGVPTVMAFDYEYAKGIPFLRPTLSLVPELLCEKLKREHRKNVTGYPGIKEDVYVHDFEPNPSAFASLGISSDKIIVTIRPPATTAHYHASKSDELFDQGVNYLLSNENIQIILLPRTKKQKLLLKGTWHDAFLSGKIMVPPHALHGLNIIWYSDMVLSGGGTMIREAAALGVPAYSIFGGKIGAVDQYLSESGRLILIEKAADLKSKLKIIRRSIPERPEFRNRHALEAILDNLVKILNKL